MLIPPAVVIHGLDDARAALAPGLPVCLLSAPGAGVYAGCGWWRAVIAAACGGREVIDILDCDDAPGRAMEALRGGQKILILDPACPAFAAVGAAAAECGAVLLGERPSALDLARRGAARKLGAWLAGDRSAGVE